MRSDALPKLEKNSAANASPGGGDQEVLRHLLKVESQASVLVDEAQAEADHRVAEAEKERRARYDEQYSKEAAALEGDYEKAVLAVKEDYQKQLQAYRDSLTVITIQKAAFSTLAEHLFFGDC